VNLNQIKQAMQHMIQISEDEINEFLSTAKSKLGRVDFFRTHIRNYVLEI